MAVGLVVGVVLALLLCAGVFVYRAAKTPEGQRVVGMVRDGAGLVREGMKAPGTKALKNAGCESAVVMDTDAWLRVFGMDAGTAARVEPPRIVVCSVGIFGKPPTCGTVAETYVKAVHGAGGSFRVIVQRQGQNKPACTGCYDADGTPIRCVRGPADPSGSSGLRGAGSDGFRADGRGRWQGRGEGGASGPEPGEGQKAEPTEEPP